MMNHHKHNCEENTQSIHSIILSSDEENEIIDEKKPLTHTLVTKMDMSSAIEPMVVKQSTYSIIDLCTPVKSSNTSNIPMKTKDYIPKTITTHNQARLSLLPTFPTPIYDNHPHLLLCNVPVQFLSIEQVCRRQQYSHQSSCTLTIPTNHSIPSSIRDYFDIHHQPLIDRLNINSTLLDYNYSRLNHCLKLFADERIHRLRQTPYQVRLLDEEKWVAMEFFLQVDVDLFYMKTYSNSMNKDLFSKNEPELKFIMKPCGHQKCGVCTLSNHITRRPQSSIDFEHSGKYRFINGYETILNGPVMCYTSGIIYVLRCVCNQYEYVGESSNNIQYTLDRHRLNGNQIIHDFLTGEQSHEYK
ncbi:unnamed protein product [Adineta steineri]|uniref:Uncharacterized protein n=1 Tax=Adineta steineri TaxID=433720 RepID=A0A816DR01_9BILA|nr:unnamed protein product [Adineta steineri]CAF1640725.1 unnamed protein product [Adineta steineri]